MADHFTKGESRPISKAEMDKEEAAYAMDQVRFEFASKVARNEELTKEDLFTYIKSYAEYQKANGIFRGRNVEEENKIIEDCNNMTLSEEVKKTFEYRLWWSKETVKGIETTSLVMQTEEFLGTKDTHSIAGRIANKAREDFLNDQAWLPYELKGLENLKHFIN